MAQEIVYQPMFSDKNEFSVRLSSEFARTYAYNTRNSELDTKFQSLGEELLKTQGYTWMTPFTFHQNSVLLDQVYIGSNGKWLSANVCSFLKNPHQDLLIYDSHNCDTQRDLVTLLKLFDIWVKYADTLSK